MGTFWIPEAKFKSILVATFFLLFQFELLRDEGECTKITLVERFDMF